MHHATQVCQPGSWPYWPRHAARWLVISLSLLAAACGTTVSPTPIPATLTPSLAPQVISTRLMAELIGQVVLVDQCLRVQSNYVPESLLLVWPADITATVTGETVQVTDLLEKKQATWHLGDIVTMAGGNLPRLDKSVQPVGPASCPGPYFVVGSVEPSATATPAARPTPVLSTATPMASATLDAWRFLPACGEPTTAISLSTLPAAASRPGWKRYTLNDYGLSVDVPPDWRLAVGSHSLCLAPAAAPSVILTIGFRGLMESAPIQRIGIAAGDTITRGTVIILGQMVVRLVLVYQAKDKAILYNSFDEMSTPRIALTANLDDFGRDYEAVALSPSLQTTADQIVASLASGPPITTWQTYISPAFHISVQYPSNWRLDSSGDAVYSGPDGYFQITAAGSVDPSARANCLTILGNSQSNPDKGNDFGRQPTMDLLLVDNQPACLVMPSDDQLALFRHQAILIVEYPNSVRPHAILQFFADRFHIRDLAARLKFVRTPLPDAAASLTAIQIVSLRAGPGTLYDVVGQIQPGSAYAVVGQAGEWWAIVLPAGPTAWVVKQLVTFTGDAQAVPTMAPPATPTLPPGVSEITQDGLVTFTTTALGLTFSYRLAQFDTSVRTRVSGERIYVYHSDGPPAAGQYVQVFHKAPGDSLQQAIQKQILPGYRPNDCALATYTGSPNEGTGAPPGYVFASLRPSLSPSTTPDPSADILATQAVQSQRCPRPYTEFGGQAYFMQDTRHPDRFFFFKIGQYSIFSAGPGQYGDPWQSTLRVVVVSP